ncbi:hypothetical protein AQUCO_00400699v1 [Aquilegia coerulea]|uniref:F-box protein At3g26010-like beta-propeller domain-containing protein n=1 Tax=Aquilegia coerulea TaxID=218851 RepID=A0A2G5EW85_AQUCA|nr:hypothetical protein AQUCO_00400699v1 [Aquilegia coerulea]
MQCMIFSSNTGKWRTHQVKLLNSSLMQNFVERDPAPFLYLGGVLHWIRMGYMLVYHIRNNFFKIKELPMKRLEHLRGPGLPTRHESYVGECLWNSEGSLHYCHAYRNLIHIWAHGEGGTDHARTLGKWQLKYKLGLEHTRYPIPMITKCLDSTPSFSGYGGSSVPNFSGNEGYIILYLNFRDREHYVELKPCGFNEDLQLFYFELEGKVFSYSFENQLTKNVCAYEYNRVADTIRFTVFPFLFNSLGLPFGGESKLVMPKKEPSQITGRPRLLLDT